MIKSLKFVGNPERMRASNNVVVALELVLLVDGEEVFKPIVITIPDDNGEVIQKQIDDVLAKYQTPSSSVPMDAFRKACSVGAVNALKSIEGNSDQHAALVELCNQKHQKELDAICYQLGIEPIDLTDMTLAYYNCVRLALTAKVE